MQLHLKIKRPYSLSTVEYFEEQQFFSHHTTRPAVRYILLGEPRQARMPLPSGLG